MTPQSSRCERARFWASLRADGELSELESALLHAHALPLWNGGFLDGKAFHAKAKEMAAANGTTLKRLRGAVG